MSMTLCKIHVKPVQDNKLNKLTGVYASYTARIRWVFQ